MVERTAFRLACLVLLLAGCTCVGWAGQRPQQQQAANPLDTMTIEEIRAFQGYFYSGGGRDPLTMRLPTDTEMGLVRKSGIRKAPTIQEQETMLAAWLTEITKAIKNRRYNQAVTLAAEAINVVDNEWPPLKSENVRAVRMNEEIRGLSRMAARLRNQREINKEFSGLGLRVDGVIWSPTEAKAVVNGRLYSAGEMMTQERKEGDLRVEMIEEHGVVFQYRGLRFRLPAMLHPSPVTAETFDDEEEAAKKK